MSTPPPAGPTPSPELGTTALPPPAAAGPSSPTSSAGPSSPIKNAQMDASSPAPATAAGEDDDDEADLFGDEDDDEDKPAVKEEDEAKTDNEEQERQGSAQPSQASGDEDARMFSDNDSITSSVRERRARLEYAEEDASEAEPETRQAVDMTSMTWNAHEGTDGSRWIMRLPKHLHHQHMAYSRELYQEPDEPVLPELLDEDVQLDAKEIERRKAEELMRQVGSTIRWRWVKGPDGVLRKQPNARIVKWSDGSLSLQLGKPSNLFSLIKHRDPSFPHAPQAYLVNHHWEAELMQTEGMYSGHMTLVPVGMEGEAHRVLAKGVKERNREKSRMKMWDDDTMVAENVDVPGVKKPRAKAVRGPRDDGTGGGGSARKKAVRSVAAAGRGRRGSIYSDESESEEDEEDRRRRRRMSGAGAGGKGKAAGGRDADEGGGYTNDGFVVDDDDDESDSRARSKSKSKSKRRASPMLSSSDDDDEEASALESEGGSSAEDEAPRKKAKTASSSSAKAGKEKRRAAREESVESEDLESEEEDDDDGPAAGEIKKRRVVIADEDEDDE